MAVEAKIKKPGDNLASGIVSGDLVKVRPGVYPPFVVRGGLKNVKWIWDEPGKHWTIDGNNRTEYNIRIHDQCARLEMVGTRTIRAGHGVRATRTESLTVRHFLAENCGAEGFQAGYCPGLLIEDFTIFGTGKGWSGSSGRYPPHKGHGIYLSKDFVGCTIRRGTIKDCGGCAIQLNANDGVEIFDPEVHDVQMFRCGTDGTPAMNLMGVKKGHFHNLLMVNNNAGIAMFTDEGSDPCEDNDFYNITIYQPKAKYGIQSLNGSKKNEIHNFILVTGGREFEGSGLRQVNVKRSKEDLVDPDNGDYRSKNVGYGWQPDKPKVPDYDFLKGA